MGKFALDGPMAFIIYLKKNTRPPYNKSIFLQIVFLIFDIKWNGIGFYCLYGVFSLGL